MAGSPRHGAGEADNPGACTLIGHSPAIQTLRQAIARLSQRDHPVLITGERGSGKALAAGLLHAMGARGDGPFLPVDLAELRSDSIESALFGRAGGGENAAPSAGRIEQARTGTLFLAGIEALPETAQNRLLQLLRDGAYTPVGGDRSVPADVRLIAATRVDWGMQVSEGRCGGELYDRLGAAALAVPPLRQRRADIPELAAHFLARAGPDDRPGKQVDAGAVAALQRYHWPGNLDELDSLIRRVAAATEQAAIPGEAVEAALVGAAGEMQDAGESIAAAVTQHIDRYFAAHGTALPPPGVHARVMREVERPLLERALEATGGNQLKAAKLLGLNRNTLRKKLRELGIAGRRSRQHSS